MANPLLLSLALSPSLYFGELAVHEGTHALTATVLGYPATVDMLPRRTATGFVFGATHYVNPSAPCNDVLISVAPHVLSLAAIAMIYVAREILVTDPLARLLITLPALAFAVDLARELLFVALAVGETDLGQAIGSAEEAHSSIWRPGVRVAAGISLTALAGFVGRDLVRIVRATQ